MSHEWVRRSGPEWQGSKWRCEKCGSTELDLGRFIIANNVAEPIKPKDDILIWSHEFSTHVNDKMTCEELQAARVMKS